MRNQNQARTTQQDEEGLTVDDLTPWMINALTRLGQLKAAGNYLLVFSVRANGVRELAILNEGSPSKVEYLGRS